MSSVHALLQAAGPTSQPGFGFWLGATVVKLIAVFTLYMLGAALLTLAERKISAWMQDRHGPNRVGKGWLQPIADGVKNFVKEETYPSAANLPLFILAPVLAFIPALVTWAVIPFAAPWGSRWGVVEMVLAPLPIGFLFILAISSLGVYGIVLAGWASNNKYAMLGGIRSTAQMVSYEIALGMSTIPVLILAGNVSLSHIINQQAFETWNVLNLTVAFFIFLVASFAETNRLPFDLPEAESELITGYHTEYSAMKFSLFFIAEYCNMITVSALMSTLFFGGWDIPFTLWDNLAPHTGLKTLLTMGAFATKVLFFLFLFMWVRWTLPRFRYDQLMALGWKVMLPLALGYIVVIATAVVTLDALGFARGSVPFHAGLILLNLAAVVILFMIVDRGRLISPASSRLNKRDIAKLRAVSSPHRPPLLPESGD
ncbi:MAG: nuoH [Gemmatimonadetes bacterium]|jgi:NADH-quinone oxidoreductase subunit H|nr:nuoH [Gemmatimonadota bacterium]